MDNILDEPWRFSQKFDSANLDQIKNELKSLYDQLKRVETRFVSSSKSRNLPSICSTLPELVVKQLDDEQIWQQLELQNADKMTKIRRKTNEIFEKFDGSEFNGIFRRKNEKNVQDSVAKSSKKSKRDQNEGEDPIEQVEFDPENDPDRFFDIDEEKEREDDDEDEEIEEENLVQKDKFFNLKEMDAFLDEQDQKAMDGAPDGEDLNLEIEESDEEDIDGSKNYKYKDFFEANQNKESEKKKVHFEDEIEQEFEENEAASGSENEEKMADDDESKPKSTFELRQEKLRERIDKLEQKNLGDKPWQQTGEVWAKHRPENSLLEEYVEFEHTTRLPPVITQVTTQKLEDIIKQRIKDKAWDDVERKVKPINEPHKYKNDLILDQQKSKVSLSQIYEQEYMKQHQVEKEDVKDEKQEEIRRLMRELFVKLDALTNYHYTPKLPQNEIKIVNNTKSITVEEVAPATVNDADLLAPEEIKNKNKFLQKAVEERSKTDKLRSLRRKKQISKEKAHRQEEKDKKAKVPKDKLKMLQKLGKIHKVEKANLNGSPGLNDQGDAKRRKVL